MQSILNIARLHMQLRLRDRSVMISSFLVPMILVVILATAMQDRPIRTFVDVQDNDQSELSTQFIEQLRASGEATDGIIVCVYGASDNPEECTIDADAAFDEAVEERIRERDIDAALLIPEGFETALNSGEPVTISYYSSDQLNTPTAAKTAIESVINQLASGIIIARSGVEIAAQEFGSVASEDYAQLRETAQISLATPSAVVESENSGKDEGAGFGASQSVPGMGTMFTLFSLLALASTMVVERDQGTLQRLFTLPTPKANIIAGKILGAFVFGVFQLAVFVIAGMFLGVDWGSNYLAIALVIIAFCLAGTALGFALATIVKTDAQAVGLMNLMGLTLAPLGGAWWPLDIVPGWMQTLGHISPIAWAMDGFQDIIYNDASMIDVLPSVAALFVMAGIFFLFALWRFRYE